MIEHLFPSKELEIVEPQRMNIGSFMAFKDFNPLGIGNQAVHNAGSSMLTDTPSFKKEVMTFVGEHFKYSDGKESDGIMSYISSQVDSLVKFKNNKAYRKTCLEMIFDDVNTLTFSDNINPEYFYISLVLFFVKEYNFMRSRQAAHSITKNKALKYYSTESDFIGKYVYQLKNQSTIQYLSDICFGRYYFLEVHFLEKTAVRVVPKSIVEEFLLTQKKHADDFDLTDQLKIQNVKPLAASELDKQNNRVPVLVLGAGRKSFKTNSRLAKTALSKVDYACEIDAGHMTFFTKRGINFSESHHLIPMAFQDTLLPTNIDREENITSLCPTCHRAVHLGREEEKIKRLKILYEKKKDALKKCGLELTFDKLKGYYI